MTSINLWSLGRAIVFLGMGIILATSQADSLGQAVFYHPRDTWMMAAGAGFGIATVGLCCLAADLAERFRSR